MNLLADVTERKEIEEKYRAIVESMEEGYYEVDLAGNYTFVNPAICRYHQAAAEELIGLNYRQYMPPEVAEKIYRLFNGVYRTGVPARALDFEVEILRKDGQRIPLDISVSLRRDPSGKPVGFRGITFDASKRRAIEAERERYRQFVENVEDGCFETDLKGNLTFINPAGAQRFGYPREELMGKNNREYTSSETAKRAYEVFNQVYRTGEQGRLFDYEVIDRDGQKRYLDLTVSLIRDASGNPIGFRGTSQDRMARKAMEEERERLLERLYRSQQMEALGNLAAGIAHDFNDLLMGIQGYVSLMLLDLGPENPLYPQLQSMESQIRKGAELTQQLLGFAGRGHTEVLPADLNDLIRTTLPLFLRLKKDIRVYEHYTEDLRPVAVDRSQMKQALMGLFLNAAEAMPGGGSLFIQTENRPLDTKAAQGLDLAPGDYVKITLTDTGQGMDEETRKRVFEPFFTTQRMGRGMGMGLATIQGIIRGYGGWIGLESEKGKGTTFSIYLPAAGKSPEGQKGKDLPGQGKRVLLVDDESVILKVVGGMLQGLGFEVVTASSGEAAVDLYRQAPERFDLIIMDMVMPGIGGKVAIDLIRSVNPDARIILASGYSLEGQAKEIIARGAAHSFLQKPFQIQKLTEKIRQIFHASD